MNPLSRFHKRVAAWLCLAAMLFAQGSNAAQACVAVEAAMDEMPCHQQEPAGRNLCQNRYLAEQQQALDMNKVPAVFSLDEVVLVLPVASTLSTATSHWPFAHTRARGGAPPLSILHCCFRI